MNNGITKQIACQLFAWGYKLVDEVGRTYIISEINDEYLRINNRELTLGFIYIEYERIGKDFFILVRSTDKLCKEIDGKVPIVSCAEMSFPELKWIKSYACKAKSISDDVSVDFGYNNEAQAFWCHRNRMITPKNQQALFNHLYSLHFAINLPEGTCKEI